MLAAARRAVDSDHIDSFALGNAMAEQHVRALTYELRRICRNGNVIDQQLSHSDS